MQDPLKISLQISARRAPRWLTSLMAFLICVAAALWVEAYRRGKQMVVLSKIVMERALRTTTDLGFHRLPPTPFTLTGNLHDQLMTVETYSREMKSRNLLVDGIKSGELTITVNKNGENRYEVALILNVSPAWFGWRDILR